MAQGVRGSDVARDAFEELDVFEEEPPSRYLARHDIILPPDLAEMWDGAAYLEFYEHMDKMGIVFENITGAIFAAGYVGIGVPREEDFYEDLASEIANFLFGEYKDRFHVYVCPPGNYCSIEEEDEIAGEGVKGYQGFFDFEIWDVELDAPVFIGSIYGSMGKELDKSSEEVSYMTFMPFEMVIGVHPYWKYRERKEPLILRK